LALISVTYYNFLMIKSFRHKELENFYFTGNRKGINPDHCSKIARILDRLDSSQNPQDRNLPAYRLHKLIGKESDFW
jgi:toxin HigB-1